MKQIAIPNQLSFENVKLVFQDAQVLMSNNKAVEISFDYLENPNSVCAALILACIKYAKKTKCQIQFLHVPKGIFIFLEHDDLIHHVKQYCV